MDGLERALALSKVPSRDPNGHLTGAGLLRALQSMTAEQLADETITCYWTEGEYISSWLVELLESKGRP